MADIGVNYSLHYSPDPVGVDLGLSASDTTLNVTLSGVPPLAVAVSPNFSGNIIESALSVVTTPMANAISLTLGAFAGQLINGRSFEIASISPINFDIQGVHGTLTPSQLTLSNWNGQLKISGELKIH